MYPSFWRDISGSSIQIFKTTDLNRSLVQRKHSADLLLDRGIYQTTSPHRLQQLVYCQHGTLATQVLHRNQATDNCKTQNPNVIAMTFSWKMFQEQGLCDYGIRTLNSSLCFQALETSSQLISCSSTYSTKSSIMEFYQAILPYLRPELPEEKQICQTVLLFLAHTSTDGNTIYNTKEQKFSFICSKTL